MCWEERGVKGAYPNEPHVPYRVSSPWQGHFYGVGQRVQCSIEADFFLLSLSRSHFCALIAFCCHCHLPFPSLSHSSRERENVNLIAGLLFFALAPRYVRDRPCSVGIEAKWRFPGKFSLFSLRRSTELHKKRELLPVIGEKQSQTQKSKWKGEIMKNQEREMRLRFVLSPRTDGNENGVTPYPD